MKIASFRKGEKETFGIVAGGRITDLGGQGASLLDVLRAGRLGALKAEGAEYALREVTLLPPVTAPEKIICVGVNYANRNEEYKDGTERPKYPSLFMRTPGSFVGHDVPLIKPRESDQFDYEGEIVLVIGKVGRRITRERALDHIAGMTLCNEGSVRDWLRHGKFNVTQGKNFDASGSIGPWMVTRDELDPAKPLSLTTRVNGEIRQEDTTENLIFSFADLIAYITTFTTLKPGDMIVTGTPTGAGARFDPPKWLKSGDVVEIDVPGIGLLSNKVVAEQ
ncbi:MAG: fumarylacetoacetate hydrolase family protein [Rhizobiales bacterium]|nr:fumarylacetoacetate hydrolase family protein [Hyphomicrobiales bacterium]